MSEDIEPYFRHNESHGLEVALTLRDEAAFSLAMKDAVPEMQFLVADPWETPEPVYLERIENRSTGKDVFIIPRQANAHWRTYVETRLGHAHQGMWKMPTDYPLAFIYARCKLIYAYKQDGAWPPLEFLVMGRFLSSQARGHEWATQIRRKVWRTAKKLMSNKIAPAPVNDGANLQPAIPSFDLWAGHDALAWLQENPIRFINEHGSMDFTMRDNWRKRWRLRPAREYTPPAGKWHRDLHARLEERYGPGLEQLPRFHREPPDPDYRPMMF